MEQHNYQGGTDACLPRFESIKKCNFMETDAYSSPIQYMSSVDSNAQHLSPASPNESIYDESDQFIEKIVNRLKFRENHITRNNYTDQRFRGEVDLSGNYPQHWPKQLQDISSSFPPPDQNMRNVNLLHGPQSCLNWHYENRTESQIGLPGGNNTFMTEDVGYNQFEGFNYVKNPCLETNASYLIYGNGYGNSYGYEYPTANFPHCCSQSLVGPVTGQDYGNVYGDRYPMTECNPPPPVKRMSVIQSSTSSEKKVPERIFKTIVKCEWEECGSMFSSEAALGEHIKRNHVKNSKKTNFVCFWKGCDRYLKPFCARYKLLIHTRIHTGDKPNKCTFPKCNKAFKTKESVKIHERTHTNEKPYKCKECSNRYNNISDCRKHEKTHQERHPYKCRVPGCGKGYTDPSSLRKHKKRHLAKKLEENRSMG